MGSILSGMKAIAYDLAVLGGGSAGFAAARTASAAGLRTVVIEGARRMGGLCILRGCMPTKALLHAAEVLHRADHMQPWGLRAAGVGFDFGKVMARKKAVIGEFADYRRQQLVSGKFKLIRAAARFLDPHTVRLSNGRKITAAHFVIATGSAVAPPPLPQLAKVGCLNSDDAVNLKRLPKSAIVLGGGPVACEFAQFLARFGVKITLIQRSPHILHEFDADAAAVIEDVFRREGIRCFTGTRLLDAVKRGCSKVVTFEHNGKRISVAADEILFALGRIPNTAGLNLEKAGVRIERNRVKTDASMRTNVPHIYAAGDCAGPYEIVHIAVAQGETAAYNIAHPRSPRTMDYRLLTSVVFTEPQVAFVGLTEKEAAARGIRFRAASYPFNDHGKSIIMEAKDGFVKLLADPESGEILGGSCVGPSGGELIHEIVTAMAARMTVRDLAAIPHYHPTLAEIWTYPAEELAEDIPNAH